MNTDKKNGLIAAQRSFSRFLIPNPKLSEISENLPELVNYAFSKWHLDNDVIDALNKHDKQSILNSLMTAIIRRQNSHVESRSY